MNGQVNHANDIPLTWRIEFVSDQFLPYLPERCQRNPGVYGFELAYWLSVQLSARGIPTGYPTGEDWGWFIEYIENDVEIMIGCASEAGQGDGYTGAAVKWRVFVRQPGWIKHKLKIGEASPKVGEIARVVCALLEAQGIEATLDADGI